MVTVLILSICLSVSSIFPVHVDGSKPQEAIGKQLRFESETIRPGEVSKNGTGEGWWQSDYIIGRDIFTRRQVATSRFFLDTQQPYKKNMSDLLAESLILNMLSRVYNPSNFHSYEDPNELANSGGSSANEHLCLHQLEMLIHLMKANGTNNVALQILLDTFGRYSPAINAGNWLWAGDYNRCKQFKFNLINSTANGRYCLVKLRHSKWSSEQKSLGPIGSELHFESGICLPEACDSQLTDAKLGLLRQLIELHSEDMRKFGLRAEGLYCLPDQSSAWKVALRSPGTAIGLILLLGWILFLIHCTLRAELFKPEQSCELKPVSNLAEPEISSQQQGQNHKLTRHEIEFRRYEWFKLFSMSHNLRALFDTKSSHRSNRLFDFRALDGLKVTCMMMIIVGHVIMCITVSPKNLMDIASFWTMAASEMVPTFCVNPFFTISGILTAYQLFKKVKPTIRSQLLMRPDAYIKLMVVRYLRIVPTYLVIMFYCKRLAKFSGSGPLWDYATGKLSQRRMCYQESWLWAVLLGANFKRPLDHCIPTAWYISNDFQFLLLTPILLTCIELLPRIKGRLLIGCITLSYCLSVMAYFRSDLEDFEPIVTFVLHGFGLYNYFLIHIYTQPQYRIPAYLIGLYFGYLLYLHEKNLLDRAEKQNGNSKMKIMTKRTEDNFDEKQSRQIDIFPPLLCILMRYGPQVSIFVIVSTYLTPLEGRLIPFNELNPIWAQIGASMSTSLQHIAFALIAGLYAFSAALRRANHYGKWHKLMTSSFWVPLARLSLSAMLVNVEVITMLIQSVKAPRYYDGQLHFAIVLLSILATYIVAIVVYLIFELPFQRLVDQLLKRSTEAPGAKSEPAIEKPQEMQRQLCEDESSGGLKSTPSLSRPKDGN